MNAKETARLITRVQIKEILRRQEDIKPGATMFDGVCPIEYCILSSPIPPLVVIAQRVQILEDWIDTPSNHVHDRN